jgi:hypothetical protein
MIEDPRKAPADTPDPNEHPHKEDLLDAALKDSMDASDPPAIVSKGQPSAPPRRPKGAREGANPGEPRAGDRSDPSKTDQR